MHHLPIDKVSALAMLLFLPALFGPAPAAADTWFVCPSGCDSSTIQGAITMASDGDTIQLATLIPQTEGGIIVFRSVQIQGLEGQGMIVQAAASEGAATTGVFTVSADVTVAIRDLEIRFGNGVFEGGAIHNSGNLTLERVEIRGSRASRGGGIFNDGLLVLQHSQIVANGASREGGGVYNSSDGLLIVEDAELLQNRVDATAVSGLVFGGGLYNLGDAALRRCVIANSVANESENFLASAAGIYTSGSLLLEDVLLDENQADGLGGALYQTAGQTLFAGGVVRLNTSNESGGGAHLRGGSMTLRDVLFEGNTADVNGGGIDVHNGGALVLDHASFYENEAGNIGGALRTSSPTAPRLHNVTMSNNDAVRGGAIYVLEPDSIRIASSTLAYNSGSDAGGGIYLGDGAVAYMRNTLIGNNSDGQPSSAGSDDCVGDLTSEGYNFVEDASTGILGACKIIGDLSGVITQVDSGMVATYADNGGVSLYPPEGGFYLGTHGLQSSSQAIDAGDPAGCADTFGVPLPKDERYAWRVGRCDIGAFEYDGVPQPPVELFEDGFESGDTAAWSLTTP